MCIYIYMENPYRYEIALPYIHIHFFWSTRKWVLKCKGSSSTRFNGLTIKDGERNVVSMCVLPDDKS